MSTPAGLKPDIWPKPLPASPGSVPTRLASRYFAARGRWLAAPPRTNVPLAGGQVLDDAEEGARDDQGRDGAPRRLRDGSLRPLLRSPFKPDGYSFWTWKGRRIHYVEQGAGKPIGLIHVFGRLQVQHPRAGQLAKKYKVYGTGLLGLFHWSERELVVVGKEPSSGWSRPPTSSGRSSRSQPSLWANRYSHCPHRTTRRRSRPTPSRPYDYDE
jgi:hypothetical protein